PRPDDSDPRRARVLPRPVRIRGRLARAKGPAGDGRRHDGPGRRAPHQTRPDARDDRGDRLGGQVDDPDVPGNPYLLELVVDQSATLIDTHAHLDDQRFDEDITEVVARAQAAGLERVITIGTDAATSRSNVELATRFPLLRCAVGIQPNHVAEARPGDWEAILELVNHSTCVAVGETGLDRYWDRAPFPLQEDYFARHLELSRRTGKPVVIHCREA